MRTTSQWIGIFGAALLITLSVVLVCFNPYSHVKLSASSITIVIVMLIVPSVLAAGACLIKHRGLLLAAIIWLLPYSLYLGLASIPTVWNLYLVSLLCIVASFLKSIYEPVAGNGRVAK
ncbi:hypothetical protein [Paenibacillus kobensis]|uniref:hypothetical protein n=1 Tax=Paenibacillus kobensis TaxID=59841 RepID=UPI000FD8F699|nr:hypothetical protein [Paenibacillus kobensis]